MVEAYDNTLIYRIGFAVVFFTVLAISDWIKHPTNPTRVKEYLFLVVAMLISIVYGLIHDHLTATISPDYFLHAKGLVDDARPFRVAVSLLAIKATYGPGILFAAFMLIANNPSPKKLQLPYARLLRFCVYPVMGAGIFAAVCGMSALVGAEQTWIRDVALAYTPEKMVARFAAVWGIHAGSYLGATLGTVLAVVSIVRLRNSAERAA